jgi:translation initiation factor 3 subunit H
MVALKIVQHCKQNLGIPVSGQLLGLEIGYELHVTDSFPLLRNEEGEEVLSDKYGEEMLKNLREVNVDTNTIGWYQSTYLGVHVKQFLIDVQYCYQQETPESVMLTYDPLVASHGSIGLKAFRLGDLFMKLRKDNSFTKEKLSELNFTFDDIYEEIPIVISSSVLAEGFMASLGFQNQLQDQYEHFELSTHDFMQKNLEALSYCFSDLQKEQLTYGNWHRNVAKQEQLQQQYIQKRKAQNIARAETGEALLPEDVRDLEIENPSLFRKPTEPSQLEALLIAHRINSHCDQVIQFAGKSLTKQYTVKGLSEV